MKKIMLLLGFTISFTTFALDNESLATRYFSQESPRLAIQEQQAIDIAERLQKGKHTSKPYASTDGSVSYVFGSGQIRIVCAPLQVCDIALQPGELFNDMNVGDPRFIVEPSITGEGSLQQIHIIIKPKDVGLDTSMVVTTNRRTYHFRLKSDRTEFMPYVSFTYPNDAKAKRQVLKQKRTIKLQPEPHEYLENLNFNYQIRGRARFKPVRVYNNGVKTIIEMPRSMVHSEAPALLVLRSRGVFHKSETVMVNYRLQGCRYIVDGVFDKAILVIGSGSSQEKVTVTRCKSLWSHKE
ncbi:TPA: P-type conjugative transfer protein TrbG [Legionella pneumophila]|uniref:Conjugal transfer protein TrbG n=1 Tax=Legionella waltersii TaxID=66969 RepID=A0A0W1AGF6_9GAMM|nr:MULTISPECIES: P-type conjugative transfer protein TrbG [Legionella]KTD80445.1 conjugal transfer protein TrbG [Legionella waltersii]MBN5936074.1 P-type conjugative transfer protein TrbG [Legionella anisa]SNV09968.1 type IV secretion system protein VirB9 [Legionella waltersii]HAT1130441.1 P-type conjugative transfer protein TrbG [Legionella pneumophila]HAT1919951.1 P-type conjugative transfer protein TrbG [Legionella pneumophila]